MVERERKVMKVGQKVTHKELGCNGVVVPKTGNQGFGNNWFAVCWTLPNGRQEKRLEHVTRLEQN